MTDNQKTMIEALEKALVDARSGRLEGFAFAGIGHGERAISYAYDDDRPFEKTKLLACLQHTRKLIMEAQP